MRETDLVIVVPDRRVPRVTKYVVLDEQLGGRKKEGGGGAAKAGALVAGPVG
jgi:hypothetical protein